jgi:hypothetical protein
MKKTLIADYENLTSAKNAEIYDMMMVGKIFSTMIAIKKQMLKTIKQSRMICRQSDSGKNS